MQILPGQRVFTSECQNPGFQQGNAVLVLSTCAFLWCVRTWKKIDSKPLNFCVFIILINLRTERNNFQRWHAEVIKDLVKFLCSRPEYLPLPYKLLL